MIPHLNALSVECYFIQALALRFEPQPLRSDLVFQRKETQRSATDDSDHCARLRMQGVHENSY